MDGWLALLAAGWLHGMMTTTNIQNWKITMQPEMCKHLFLQQRTERTIAMITIFEFLSRRRRRCEQSEEGEREQKSFLLFQDVPGMENDENLDGKLTAKILHNFTILAKQQSKLVCRF